MYGCMAIAQFGVYRHVFGSKLASTRRSFATAFPVNWRLIKAGVKEKM